MPPIAETERLRLREFTERDLDSLAAMVGDEDQMGFYPAPRSRDEAAAWLDRNFELYREHGVGIWLIETRDTSKFAGYCGIRPLDLEGATETEIGWHVKKTFWNQGVATEAAKATIGVAAERFGRSRLVALIPPDHAASRRVAEKIGMREDRTTVFEGEKTVIYLT